MPNSSATLGYHKIPSRSRNGFGRISGTFVHEPAPVVSRAAPARESIDEQLARPNERRVISQRTEVIERQQEDLEERLRESLARHSADSRTIFDDSQWVYATSSAPITGRREWDDPESEPLSVCSSADERLLLVYPQRAHTIAGGSVETLMRCKIVDPETCQLTYAWIVVDEERNDGTHERFVRDFALVP